jgi:hypothetical protein
LLVAVLVSGFALALDAFADPTGLDLEGWFKEPPRIRELVARRTQSDGKVKYLLLVADGSNYVVKMAPSEKLLRARVLTREVDAVGRCGDEFWTASRHFSELRIVRTRDLISKETNHVKLTLTLNYAVARLGLAFLRLGSEPLQEETDFRVTPEGFESSCDRFFKKVTIERVERSGDGLRYKLSGTTTGDDIVGGVSRFQIRGELEPPSFIPVTFSVYDPDLPDNPFVCKVELLSLKLSDSPIPLVHFRPESYVREGFYAVMEIRDGKLVMFPASHPSWRKVVFLGWVLPYRVIKWGGIALIATATVVAAILVRKTKTTTPTKRT